jgi:hypothetical protein
VSRRVPGVAMTSNSNIRSPSPTGWGPTAEAIWGMSASPA